MESNVTRLRTVPRRIRTAARRQGVPGTAAAFVRGLAGRRLQPVPRSRPHLTVLRARVDATRTIHNDWHLRMALSVTSAPVAVRRLMAAADALPARGGTIRSMTLVLPVRMVDAPANRWQRIEQGALPTIEPTGPARRQRPPSAPSGSPPALLPVAPPVAMVIRRPAALRAQPDDLPGAPHRAVPGHGDTGLPLHRPSAGLDAGLDLGRLTDQVIRTIDQRILAQRERLGRF
jgi:hypothetical protein